MFEVLAFIGLMSAMGLILFFGLRGPKTLGEDLDELAEFVGHDEVEKEKKKSDAFTAGYTDMATKGVGNSHLYVRDYTPSLPSSISEMYIRGNGGYYSVDSNTLDIVYDNFNNVKFISGYLKATAKKVMSGSIKINPDAGQCNVRYLGGTDQEFSDYYAGGMKFLEDLDEAKQEVIEEKIEKENRDRLIASRKAGLKDTNRIVVVNMEALDELRATTFKPQLTEKQEWDQKMLDAGSEAC